jgi:hypothetical protein
MLAWLIGRRMKLKRPAYRALTLASLLPDIDAVTLIFGMDFLLKYHATLSHSLVLWLLLALTVSPLLRSWRIPLALLLGAYLHILVDILLNTGIIFRGGVWCLWPFSEAECLLAYHINVPTIAFRAVYISLEILLYSAAIYFIWKREYPWEIWIGGCR